MAGQFGPRSGGFDRHVVSAGSRGRSAARKWIAGRRFHRASDEPGKSAQIRKLGCGHDGSGGVGVPSILFR